MSHLVLTLRVLTAVAQQVTVEHLHLHRTSDGRRPRGGMCRDAGLSTLEVVVIALGLFLVAGVLVAAITTAVNNRIAQIN